MKLKYSILAASLVGMVAANAATIVWNASLTPMEVDNNTISTGLFDQTGTLFLAENVGGGATPWDGINFTDGSKGVGTVDFFGDDPGALSDGTNGANALTTVAQYGANDTTGTVSLTGLTNGYTYRIQALVYDGRGTSVGRSVQFDSQNMGTFANGTVNVDWGAGLLVTGTFTATGTTQDFTTAIFLDNTYATNKGQNLNALTVYTTAVPEPSSTALLGLGGLALIMRRRK